VNLSPFTTSTRLNRAQASQYLGVPETTLRRWAIRGYPNLPFLKLGGRVYYERADLDALVERSRVNPVEARA
jgi:excisionase family DNA binding protein